MLRTLSVQENQLRRSIAKPEDPAGPVAIPAESVWVDLAHPTAEEHKAVRALFGFDPPTQEDMDEIEISSRLYQEDGAVFMTALVLSKTETDDPECTALSFVLAGDRLLTVRYSDPQPLNTFANRAERQTGRWQRADIILAGLLDAIVDRTADVLEKISGDVETLSKTIFRARGQSTGRDYETILVKIGKNNDLTSKARESLISLGRVIAFLSLVIDTKASKDMKGRIKTLTRDIQSLADHTTYLSTTIAFLLEALLGVVNVEQSRIIKIFSVVAVVFLPPTLIASVYGMNFQHMPELSWTLGYPTSLVLMTISAVLPYLYFKWRGWM